MRPTGRLAIWSAAAPILAGCATGSGTGSDTAAVDRACGVEDCFLERDVRDFEVLNNTTLILYVGAQRCPFRVELDGTFCDLTMAPQIFFRSPEERRLARARGEDDLDPRNRIEQQRRHDQLGAGAVMTRICSNDRVEVDGGVFTDDFGVPGIRAQRRECVIRTVASLTDDQLVELYVDRGVVAPPPPIGPGEIEVNPEEQSEAPAAEPETSSGDGAAGPSSPPAAEPSTAAARGGP